MTTPPPCVRCGMFTCVCAHQIDLEELAGSNYLRRRITSLEPARDVHDDPFCDGVTE